MKTKQLITVVIIAAILTVLPGCTHKEEPENIYLLVGWTGNDLNENLAHSGWETLTCTGFPTMKEIEEDVRNSNEDMGKIIIVSIYKFSSKQEKDQYLSERPDYNPHRRHRLTLPPAETEDQEPIRQI